MAHSWPWPWLWTMALFTAPLGAGSSVSPRCRDRRRSSMPPAALSVISGPNGRSSSAWTSVAGVRALHRALSLGPGRRPPRAGVRLPRPIERGRARWMWPSRALPTAVTWLAEVAGSSIRRTCRRAVAALSLGARGGLGGRRDDGKRSGMIGRSVTTKSTAAERTRTAAEPGALAMVCLLAWLLPGAGHLWLGRRQKGSSS